jgi:hypothetical protein
VVSTLAVAVNGEFSIVIINTESKTQDGNVGNECAATAVQVFFLIVSKKGKPNAHPLVAVLHRSMNFMPDQID